jgi:hypothetical protein
MDTSGHALLVEGRIGRTIAIRKLIFPPALTVHGAEASLKATDPNGCVVFAEKNG